ncbi:uncharacterized protein LOC117180171 isoform X2 [Belonocnema kinseyi]|uniref:uncharacterized protein LOC117180171 isoform X2 n=1 Tax=Belonocnema kinseyi TaxID=2817044 RepID=UPI00143DCB74|nr:uncharacterized protein LOC117180171 isoform X2 [Belonocnema kinseyi]
MFIETSSPAKRKSKVHPAPQEYIFRDVYTKNRDGTLSSLRGKYFAGTREGFIIGIEAHGDRFLYPIYSHHSEVMAIRTNDNFRIKIPAGLAHGLIVGNVRVPKASSGIIVIFV